ncbi:MAG: N-acetyl sugar amidotransferase [Alphaproteobacteria bacterium]|nr:N-acetyl sugar amidotransferase [Alphaproteobacteria bacterium]
MKYCVRCLYPANHPLHLTFDEDGVCSGCRVHEEKDELDWTARADMLETILARYRGKAPGKFDCVVPVSGARDSFFILDLLVRRFGMNPLLVNYNRQHNTPRGIRNLAYLRTWFDGDFMQHVVSPRRVQAITRETIHRIGSMYWHVLAGQTVFPVQVATRFKIPLIIWGAHQGIDQVGMFSHTDEVEMTRKYRCDHDLMGIEAEDLVDGVEGLTESDMVPYMYPHDREISRIGVRGIYLNNYVRWDTKAQHEDMLAKYDYETAELPRTFDTCNDVDCQHHSGLHDWVKFVKWGYGRASDHASREIRLRRMTREQGIEMVARYQDVAPPDKDAFLEWVGLSGSDFDAAIDRFRDPRIWENDHGSWTLRDSVLNHRDDPGVDAARLPQAEPWQDFPETPSKDPDAAEQEYVLMARGYSDNHRVRPPWPARAS